MLNMIFIIATFSAGLLSCISNTEAQLDSYYKLSRNEIREKCKNNAVDLNEINEIYKDVYNFYLGKHELSIEDALSKTDDNCMGDLNLTNIIQSGLKVIQNCLKDDISLTDDDIKVLIRKILNKLCTATRLKLYENSLSNCMDKDYEVRCREQLYKSANVTYDILENARVFTNIGLKYSPKELEIFDGLFYCSSTRMCTHEQSRAHMKLTLSMMAPVLSEN
ncbi:uncharacterized protein LOC127280776 isoform X5 [Leptopilina boulardi]|uniref:uncharacterized protein LOC127280775 isoform X2 n=1 Tax=Leptopilina boulardi TaxID=63433 RepID=UPI0021F629A8|nr:uncharacterized protein LOC127280775 isoform X2 [Leptopilina boulardi]XP_051159982.1 uncharacterized protein LOC127280775 isoform X3 [Leptopilina boulardi]XP_051159983.1 uncharacterized protein LOC127280775 isoform X4 [Leptopilina boulardi]XP_051159984.1 uncharacterized protein LOC127280775 isoform X5 [Leptopilina boulardi]XP_051159986.1 uncharacterized protein LOC127280776 isoform X2 [Leptopilina boulardi]XP_051159987.1 uncharacterized protein LOC127280776 isoform X3 [Leptopilina boulardi]